MVLIWVLKANNQTGQWLLAIEHGHIDQQNKHRTACLAARQSIKPDTSYNQAYFQSLTVWYVMKHCEDAITVEFESKVLLPELERLARFEDERKKYSEDRVSTPKSDILQWFRFRCLDLICKRTLEENEIVDWYRTTGLETDIQRSQAECEKFVLRLRESRQGPDSTIDEEIDRLYLLGDELGFFKFHTQTPYEPPADLAEARAREAQERIQSKKPTSYFNPGPKSGLGLSRASSHAPWELTYLNHHSALRVAVWVNDLDDLARRRNDVFHFILSDHTFMTSWNRADSTMIGKWWDMEPASVICATLIDLKLQGW
jgi:hypothetical protein